MTFRGDRALRIVDVDLTLKALTETTFGDSAWRKLQLAGGL
jgi:hypothetical protein